MKANKISLIIILLGLGILFYEIQFFELRINNFNDGLTFFLLLLFLFILKRFPMPISIGLVSLEFPILYICTYFYGYIETVMMFSLVIFALDLFKRHPTVFIYNIMNYTISLWCAMTITEIFTPHLFLNFQVGIIHLLSFLSVYTLINNFLVDIILWLRPQPFTFAMWYQKCKIVSLSIVVSMLYGFMFHFFIYEGRSTDVIGVVFFFLPLISISVLSHVITQLIIQKNKLETLFLASKKMNESIDEEEVLDGIQEAVSKVIEYTFGIIYEKKDGNLVPRRVFGYEINENRSIYLSIGQLVTSKVLEEQESILIPKLNFSGAKSCEFKMTAVLAVPIILENEVIGLIVVGKERPYSYYREDQTILQTIANQASAATKNTRLVREREKRIVVEERNRLAREIHDGIAQSIAAIAMQIETSIRFFEHKPEQVKKWLEESLHSLRVSLREIRQSIYALRPNPIETVGLEAALKTKLEEFQLATGISCRMQTAGEHQKRTSNRIEEAMFLVVTESLQNIYKHARASKVGVFLQYDVDKVEMLISDNGVGFTLSEVLIRNRHEKHFGILNMNELVSKHNGSFEINSQIGKGTEIIVSIPFINEKEDFQDGNQSFIS